MCITLPFLSYLAWIPYSKQKAREAKDKAMHTDLATLKAEAKTKGIEVKDDALNAVCRDFSHCIYEVLFDDANVLGASWRYHANSRWTY